MGSKEIPFHIPPPQPPKSLEEIERAYHEWWGGMIFGEPFTIEFSPKKTSKPKK